MNQPDRANSSAQPATDLEALRDQFSDPLTNTVGVKGEVENSPREHLVMGILQGLYSGRFRPGQRLIESRLAEEFGLSRGPIREVLNRLAAAGVVEITMQRGAKIRKLTLKEAIDSFVVSGGLIKLGARLAAEQIDEQKAGQLQDALDYFSLCAREMDQATFALSRNNFFLTVLKLSENGELFRILPGFHTHLIRVQFSWALESADEHCARDYRKIARAIMSGNPTAAEKACDIHFSRVVEALRAAERVTSPVDHDS